MREWNPKKGQIKRKTTQVYDVFHTAFPPKKPCFDTGLKRSLFTYFPKDRFGEAALRHDLRW